MKRFKIIRVLSYLPRTKRYLMLFSGVGGVIYVGVLFYIFISFLTERSTLENSLFLSILLISLLVLYLFYHSLKDLLNSFKVGLREALFYAENSDNRKRLNRLGSYENSEVRLLVAKNPATSATIIHRLVEDDEIEIQDAAREHPNYDFMKWAEEFAESERA